MKDLKLTQKQEYKEYEFKSADFGAYISGGNFYVDFSNQGFMDSVNKAIDDYFSDETLSGTLGAAVLKNTIGGGKFYFNNVLTNEDLPLAKKSDLTEEAIAAKVKEVFGVVSDEDLKQVMTLLHNTGNDSYDLKFEVADPAIINRTYANTESEYQAKCDAVNLAVEASTNGDGVFKEASVKGYVSLSGKTEEQKDVSVKLTMDMKLSIDYSGYKLTNPSFSEFKNGSAILSLIEKTLVSFGEGEEE